MRQPYSGLTHRSLPKALITYHFDVVNDGINFKDSRHLSIQNITILFRQVTVGVKSPFKNTECNFRKRPAFIRSTQFVVVQIGSHSAGKAIHCGGLLLDIAGGL